LLFRLADPNALVFGKEPILRDAEIVGRLTSASYGWSTETAIGMGYVTWPEGVSLKQLADAEYQVTVAGRPVEAFASVRGLYDPSNSKMRD